MVCARRPDRVTSFENNQESRTIWNNHHHHHHSHNARMNPPAPPLSEDVAPVAPCAPAMMATPPPASSPASTSVPLTPSVSPLRRRQRHPGMNAAARPSARFQGAGIPAFYHFIHHLHDQKSFQNHNFSKLAIYFTMYANYTNDYRYKCFGFLR